MAEDNPIQRGAETPPISPRWWRRGTRLLGLAIVLAFVGLLVYGLTTTATDASLDEALSQGLTLPAPGFDLAMLESGRPGRLGPVWERAATDGRVGLEELRGTPIALNFWASWCDPCRAEITIIERHWRLSEQDGVLVLGINQQDAQEDAREFLNEFAITFPQIRDPGKETARAWGVTGTPETFFISRSGDVVGHVIGVISDEEMAAGIVAARTGRPAGVKAGGDRRPTR